MTASAELFSSALLVEDERNLATALKIALKQLGIPARHVPTLTAAREEIRENPAEFVLLDRALPDGDGLTLCEELRAAGYTGSILILTAAGQPQDRVVGLNSGADDYLPKPFSWDELSARIRALARRKQRFNVARPEDLWSLDPDRLKILGPTGWMTLTPLEFKLASKLISADGSIVSRDHLLKDVWGFSFMPKTRTVDHFLGRLRKRFEKNPEEPRHFITVRGAGYRFER